MDRLTKAVLIAALFVWCMVLWGTARAMPLDPLVDYRYAGAVVRDANGNTARSTKVLNAFKKQWACPSTGKHSGPCPGWAINHTIPLACGGRDIVSNLDWMPDEAKSCASDWCRDRYERRIYGGNGMSKGCP